MAQIIIEIKDGYVNGLGAVVGNPIDPVDGITGWLQQIVDSKIAENIVKIDNEVILKQHELDTLISQKLLATKEAVKG